MPDYGFSVRDIVAVGMADSGGTSTTDRWTKEASATTNIAKIDVVQGGISIRLDGNPVDAFSYGTVYESRILQDPIPELTFSVLLTDSTNAPVDNRTAGDLLLIEFGLKNANSEKLIMQFANARCVGINYSFPDGDFATVDYTYRGTDFRVTTLTNRQIVSTF